MKFKEIDFNSIRRIKNYIKVVLFKFKYVILFEIKKQILEFKKLLQNNKSFLIFFFTSLFVYLMWFIVYYPGNMSPDSIVQWEQCNINKFNNFNPIIHTLLICALRYIWNNPAVVSLTQIITTSVLSAYFLNFLIKNKVSRLLISIIFILFIISPPILIYNIILWKDVMFAQGVFLLGIRCVIDLNNAPRATSLGRQLSLGFIVVITSALRHNGIIYIFIIPLLYFVFRILKYKELIKLVLIIFVIYFSLNNLLFRLIDVYFSPKNQMTSYLRIQFIAEIIKKDEFLYEDEKEVIEKILPLEDFKRYYHCSAIDYLWGPNFNLSPLNDTEYLHRFNEVTGHIIMRNLPEVISNRVCLFSYAIGLGNQKHSMFYVNDIIENSLGLEQKGNLYFKTKINKSLWWSVHFPQRVVFWCHATNIVVYLIFLLESILRKNKLLLVYILIIFINVPIIFLMGVARDFRYLYMLQFGVFFLLPLSRMKSLKKK